MRGVTWTTSHKFICAAGAAVSWIRARIAKNPYFSGFSGRGGVTNNGFKMTLIK